MKKAGKIAKWCCIILGVIVLLLIAGGWWMFGEEIKAAGSIAKL